MAATHPAPTSVASLRPEPGKFRLTGRSRSYDPRTHAVRRDVADIALADRIFAPHYARAQARSITASSVMLRTEPRADAVAGSQLLLGESFYMLDETGGWAWGFSGYDHYVGYVRADTLTDAIEPTHIVVAREAPMFAGATIKAPVMMTLTLGARLTGALDGDFLATPLGFVHRRHVAPIDTISADPVAVAERLLGAPYLWGGRGAGGVDCSGLVQLALSFAGHECPRDTDQQRAALGHALEAGEPYRRGDLVFFPGHVGLMIDQEKLIHANAWWMAVTIEPLEDVVARLRPDHDDPLLSAHRLAS